jgi:hypothetical protein
MKQLLLVLCSVLTMAGAARAQEGGAQPNPNKGEIIQKIIIAHLTQKLSLSVEEAQQFWPVFNNFQGEWKKAFATHKDDVIKRDEEVLAIKKKYKPEFQRVLKTEDRANRVYVEYDKILFKLKNIQERRQQRRENPPANPRPGGRGGRQNI